MKLRILSIGLGAALAGAMLWSASSPILAASSSAATAVTSQVNGPEAVKTALTSLGTRYLPGGTTPQTGFDDVGFVQWVYAQQGITLPSGLRAMRAMAFKLHATGLHPGHLVFFKNTSFAGLSHVGIWMGKGRFVHAEWYNYGVTETWLKGDPKDGNYWASRYLGRSTLATVPTGPGSPRVGDTIVTVAALRVHAQPSLLAPVVKALAPGTRFTVAKVHKGWILLGGSGGPVGWVLAQYTSTIPFFVPPAPTSSQAASSPYGVQIGGTAGPTTAGG